MSLSVGDVQIGVTIDKSSLSGALNSAKGDVTSWASSVEGSFGNIGKKSNIGTNLLSSLNSSKSNFSSIGTEIGASLTSGIGNSFGALGGVASSAATALGPVGIAAGVVAAGLAAIGTASVSAASQWENGMAGISKTTGLVGSDLDALGSSLLEMSTRMPVAASGLQDIASVAGSLGVGKDQIAGFTEAASMMAVGFEMSADVAATSAAKILTAYGQPIDTSNMMALGNVVNSMGDNFAATEPQVLDFINRASFLNTTMNMSIPSVAALGTTLISVGMEAEVAATGIKSALNMGMSETSKTGGLVNWAKLMGVSVDELKDKIGTDLSGTMVETANKIASMEDPVQRFQTAVALFGSEGAPAVLKLAGQTDALNKALTAANSEWAAGSSLQKTYTAQSETLTSRFSLLANTLNMVAVSVGTPMLPWISGAVNALQQLIVVAFNAGAAIVGIVSNSEAFQALEEAVGSVAGVVQTTFGNFVSLVQPAWDALGGGEAVLGVLQSAFNAVTKPITLTFTALGTVVSVLGKVASAVSPVASAIGGALGTAIKTASAYVQAFTEAFSNLGPIKSFQSAIEGAADVAEKVWNGLSTAIPLAFSGAFEAVKTLITGFISWVGDALGVGDIGTKITDGIKTSLGEGITGWIGSISGRANELLGAGEEIAKPVADGVKTDEELQKAAAEALQTPEALKAAEEAGGAIADKTLSGFAQQAKMSGLGDAAMLAMINGQSTGDSRIKEAVFSLYGKTVKYWYDAAEKNPITYLAIDDQMVFSESKGSGKVWSASEVLSMLGLPQPEKIEEASKMEGDKAAAAIMSVKEAAKAAMGKGLFDIEPALTNIDSFSTQLSARLKGLVANVGREIEGLGNAPAYEATRAVWTKEAQALIDALAEPIGVEGFAKVKSALTGISDWTSVWAGTYGSTAEDAANEYKDKLLAGITDMQPYVSQECTRLADSAVGAIEDGFLSYDDTILLNELLSEANILREIAPDEFRAAGGEVTVALIEGIKSGDIKGPAAAKAKEATEAIKATLSEGASLENYGALGEQYYALAKAMGTKWTQGMQEDADTSMAEYKERLSGAITDIEAFTEDAMGTAGSLASKAFSDHVFTDDDLVSLQTNLLPMLEMVEELSPEYFESAAGKAWLAFEDAIKDGDPDEIVKAYKNLGKDSGEAFSKGLLDGANLEVTLAQLKADPATYAKYISNPMVYAANSGYEQTKEVLKKVIDAYKLEGMDSEYLKSKLLEAFVGVENYIPEWVQRLNAALSSNQISLGQYLAYYEYYSGILDEAGKKTEKSTKSTETNTKAVQKQAETIDVDRLALEMLNAEMGRTKELSGTGLTISFSPAKVIADEAKNALILGAQIGSKFLSDGGSAVKIGFDQWGREVAVIGKVAQEQWARNGELISANIKTSSDSAATTTKAAATEGKGIHVAGMTDGNTLFLENTRTINTENKLASDNFLSRFDLASRLFTSGIQSAGSSLASQLNLAGGNLQSKIDIGATGHQFKINSAAQNAASQSNFAANYLKSQGVSAADYNYGKQVAGGNWIYEKGVGAANALGNAGNSILSIISNATRNVASYITGTTTKKTTTTTKKTCPFDDPWMCTGKWAATGMMTTGPQMAVIGEDGPAFPEFVIPTKTKRWDLMEAAMAAYGIPGFAEGTATGTATANTGEPSGMTATFGITGLASMSAQVKRIINDLKSFFRITWAIIKSEGAKYWRQTNDAITTEVTAIRDNGWQAALDIRNAWISANAAIGEDAKAFWGGYWAAVEPSVSSIKDNFIQSFTDIKSRTKDAIDGMVLNSESSLQAFETSWSDIWSQLVSDMSDAQTQISEGVAVISEALKSISVNVNINANIGGGGYGGGVGGGGGFPGDWGFGSDGDWLAPTGDWDTTAWSDYGSVCGQSYMDAVIASTGPLATAGLGYTGGSVYSGGSSGGTYSGSPSGYSLPAIFAARGALLDDGPNRVIAGEAGPELILPNKFTQLFTAMADDYAASPEDEFAGLFSEPSTVNSNNNIIRSSWKTKPEDEFASLFGDTYTVLPKVNQFANIRAPDMVLPTRAGAKRDLASVDGGSSANIENLLEKLLEAVKGLGIDVFIDSDEVGKKVMKKLQRKGASF